MTTDAIPERIEILPERDDEVRDRTPLWELEEAPFGTEVDPERPRPVDEEIVYPTNEPGTRGSYDTNAAKCWRRVSVGDTNQRCSHAVPEDPDHVGLCATHILELRQLSPI